MTEKIPFRVSIELNSSMDQIELRALVPNAITAAALCAGLTGIRFAITDDFDKAVLATQREAGASRTTEDQDACD